MIEPDKGLEVFAWCVRDMKGRFTGVEVGFLGEIFRWALDRPWSTSHSPATFRPSLCLVGLDDAREAIELFFFRGARTTMRKLRRALDE